MPKTDRDGKTLLESAAVIVQATVAVHRLSMIGQKALVSSPNIMCVYGGR